MKTTIFWDNDGVLVETERYYFQATKEILAGEGVILTEDLFAEHLLKASRGAWFLISPQPDELYLADLRNKRDERYKSLLSEKEIAIPYAEECVRELSKHFTMAIVTSSKKEPFHTIHKRTNILQYMDFILCREDYSLSKPDPEPYLTALKISGKSKEECLIIEDSMRGKAAAEKAEIDCWIVESGFSKYQNFSDTKHYFPSIRDIFYKLQKQ